MTKVINSPAAEVPRKAKKAEGKKRKSPCTPYREKGKGKENNPGACSTGLSRAHARGVGAKRVVSAAVEDALRAFSGTRGGRYSDERLWAGFVWEFGVDFFRDLCDKAMSEICARSEKPPRSEWPRILQAVLSPHWNRRFPKKGGAR